MWDLKWIYPELMTGPDIIRAVFESLPGQDNKDDELILKAFLLEQYNQDEQVRFKQVDLQKDLFSLFVDIPILLHNPIRSEGENHISPLRLYRFYKRHEVDLPDYYKLTHDEYIKLRYPSRGLKYFIGAAAFLLNAQSQKEIPYVVLEGAPGQGKSTIVQYLCQIQRMKLLGISTNNSNIPQAHLSTPTALPFKIVLRDLALWLSGEDPFAAERKIGSVKPNKKSVESFMAAQISHHSGGADFNVNKLLAVLSKSNVLLVFDGLDEVADVPKRKDVVKEIDRCVNKLRHIASSLQVIVTSRPAAFANSPGMRNDRFFYLTLGSVTRGVINKYTSKWLEAKNLTASEKTSFKKTLKSKLNLPHIEELARNPMQLAILLSLIHTRGVSLPDKRTALYDGYVELFFNREAEKSSVVRDNRVLLMDIHQYLAWILHSESEMGNMGGSIPESEMHKVIANYLDSVGVKPELATTLFKGMVERVVAIVSRIEGTYEFEVQPLREYFAAKFLYETAPYSPPGKEKKGTKPDRFEVISKNFYWLNVGRFYAGCYSKGELDSLYHCLETLHEDPFFGPVGHSRLLSVSLLKDWVFSQNQKLVSKTLRLILDDIGLVQLTGLSNPDFGISMNPQFPDRCGREFLLKICFGMFNPQIRADRLSSICDLLKPNSSNPELIKYWFDYLNNDSTNLQKALEIGGKLKIYKYLTNSQIDDIVNKGAKALTYLFWYGGDRKLAANSVYAQNMLDNILLGKYLLIQHLPIYTYAMLLNIVLSGRLFTAHYDSLSERFYKDKKHVEMNIVFDELGKAGSAIRTNEPYADKVKSLINIVDKELDRPSDNWRGKLEPWSKIISNIEELFGSCWATIHLSVLGAAIKSREATCKHAKNLFDSSIPIIERVRYARLRSGNNKWWEKHLSQITNNEDYMLWLLVLISYGSQRTISVLLKLIDKTVCKLAYENWALLYTTLNSITSQLGNHNVKRFSVLDTSDYPINDLTIILMLKRSNSSLRMKLCKEKLLNYCGNNSIILRERASCVLEMLLNKKINWHDAIALFKGYKEDLKLTHSSQTYFSKQLIVHKLARGMPLDTCQIILNETEKYPNMLIEVSQICMKSQADKHIIPVGKVANNERWFKQN